MEAQNEKHAFKMKNMIFHILNNQGINREEAQNVQNSEVTSFQSFLL